MFVSQPFEAAFDFWQVFVAQKIPGAGNKGSSQGLRVRFSGHGLSLNEVTVSIYGRLTTGECYSSSSSVTSGGRLCLAFRPAGRATSSGFERVKGCPGGAIGFRILSNTGLGDLPFPVFREVLFVAIIETCFADRKWPDASSVLRPVSTGQTTPYSIHTSNAGVRSCFD